MPRNTIPRKIQQLIPLAERMARGLGRHGRWIGLPDLPPETLRFAVQQIQDKEVALAKSRNTKRLAQKRVALADKVLQAWLTKARMVVMLAYGARWSEAWKQTGFINRQTNIPKRLQFRIALGQKLVAFFSRHPELGVAFAEITAAKGRPIYDRVVQSYEIFEMMSADCSSVKKEKEAAEAELRRLMSRVLSVLEAGMEGWDARWFDFGFKPWITRAQGDQAARQSEKTAAISFPSEAQTESHRVAAA